MRKRQTICQIGLIFAVRNATIPLRDKQNKCHYIASVFTSVKMLAYLCLLYSGVNVCLAATELSIFRCVASAAHFFILGANDVKEPFTFYRTIDGTGRIVIPRDLRQAVGLKAGDTVTIRITEGGILLCPLKKQ